MASCFVDGPTCVFSQKAAVLDCMMVMYSLILSAVNKRAVIYFIQSSVSCTSIWLIQYCVIVLDHLFCSFIFWLFYAVI